MGKAMGLFVKLFDYFLFQMWTWVLVFSFPVCGMFQATADFNELTVSRAGHTQLVKSHFLFQ